jgi:hypothetical protein
MLGGGLDLGSSTGAYFDAKAAALAALGSSAPGSLGTSQPDLFPASLLGVYAELDLLEWLGVRVEPRVSVLGSSYLAFTDAGAAFDRYGAFFFGLLLPLYVRGMIPLGPGSFTITAGGFGGMVLGDVGLTDKYVSSITTAWVPLRRGQLLFFGVSGGIGYSLPLGPGVAFAEIRADWALSPVQFTIDSKNGALLPFGAALIVGYGMRIGGGQ